MSQPQQVHYCNKNGCIYENKKFKTNLVGIRGSFELLGNANIQCAFRRGFNCWKMQAPLFCISSGSNCREVQAANVPFALLLTARKCNRYSAFLNNSNCREVQATNAHFAVVLTIGKCNILHFVAV